MSKLLRNKRIIAFLGLALSVLLVVALIPQINIAHGSKDDVLVTEETSMPVTGDITEDGEELDNPDGTDESGDPEGTDPDSTDPAPDGEETQTSDQDYLNAAMALKDEVPNAELYNEEPKEQPNKARSANAGISTQSEPEFYSLNTDLTTGRPDAVEQSGNGNTYTVKSSCTWNPVFSGSNTYTLKVNEGVTLKGHIVVRGGATLNLKGTGTINPNKKPAKEGSREIGSVILVEGNGSKLILNEDVKGTANNKSKDVKVKETDKDGNTKDVNYPVKYKGLTITGGTGTLLTSPTRGDVEPREDKGRLAEYAMSHFVAGGGISVDRKTDTGVATLEMYGGLIINNTSNGGGGGIFVDRGCIFNMVDGAIVSNIAQYYGGGGIFVCSNNDGSNTGHSTITSGTIVGNTTNTYFDWGGGGIFIENAGNLKIGSVLVTKNAAKGLGGGISGCPHAKTGIGDITEGAALYGNVALKQQRPLNSFLHALNADTEDNYGKKFNGVDKILAGDVYAWGVASTLKIPNTNQTVNYTSEPWVGTWVTSRLSDWSLQSGAFYKAEFTKDKAMDYYCTNASYVSSFDYGQAEGNGWTGYEAGVRKEGNTWKAYGKVINELPKGESVVTKGASLGLTCKTTDAGITGRNVEISYNTSATHGGGIGCNGSLSLGSINRETKYGTCSFEFQKNYQNSQGDDDLNASGFKFALYSQDPSQNANVEDLGTFTSASDGKVLVTVPESVVESQFENANNGDSREINLYLKEVVDTPDSHVTYDQNVYAVTLKVTCKATTYNVPALSLKRTEKIPQITEATIVGNSKTATATQDVSQVNDPTHIIVSDFVVTNIRSLQTSIDIPVTKKVSEGVEGTFNFQLVEVNAPSDTSNLKPGDLTVKSGTEEKTASIAAPAADQANFSFDYTTNKPDSSHWYMISEIEDQTRADSVNFDTSVYLVRVDLALNDAKTELSSTIGKIWKASNANSTFSEGNSSVVFKNVKVEYSPLSLTLTKEILTTLDEELDVDHVFNFELYDGETLLFKGVNEGAVITLEPEAKETIEGWVKEAYNNVLSPSEGEDPAPVIVTGLTLKETDPDTSEERDTNMKVIGDLEGVTLKIAVDSAIRNTENTEFIVTPKASLVVNGEEYGTVTNRYEPHGSWTLEADKYFYGFGAPATKGYQFTMVELAGDPSGAASLAEAATKKNAEGQDMIWTGETGEFDENGNAAITFPAVDYVVEGTDNGQRDDRDDHWYLVTENGAGDPTAFVVKVTVARDDTDKTKLNAEPTGLWYADSIDSPIAGTVEKVEFYNTDTTGLISAAGYKVYAASGAPVDQVCYVDPKIIKNLEGRAIKTGEFAFKLIQVQNYDDTEGELISATTNDEIGMVDFDKAADKTGDLENPSCLEYKNAGTYYYRVIEDKSNGGMSDESVLYSDQIITFTTVIDKDDDGKLVCTDMYYGYWDAKANKNVRFNEQYEDYDTNPANIGDFTKLNPKWHPTITNKVRPMDLQVRKTSTAAPTEGLAGATYGLYMVSGSSTQGDILLDEATSEEGGWITFKNVSLATGNLYYFQETAAPAGHTVSQFRSDYFSLMEDAASPNGYTLAYSSTKDEQPQTQMEVAPKAAAADSETQPGFSEDGSILLTYNSNGGVSDEPTQVDVNKLDTRTHEWVEGAELAIIEKDTGKEVTSWTSGKAPQKLEKTLNVGTTYILRETQAPENYNKAKDVEFVIDSYGNVSVLSGTENGNAELSDNTITLYDTMLDTEVVDTEEREIPREEREKGVIDRLLAQTGDTLPIVGLGLLALVSLVVACVALRRRNSHR